MRAYDTLESKVRPHSVYNILGNKVRAYNAFKHTPKKLVSLIQYTLSIQCAHTAHTIHLKISAHIHYTRAYSAREHPIECAHTTHTTYLKIQRTSQIHFIIQCTHTTRTTHTIRATHTTRTTHTTHTTHTAHTTHTSHTTHITYNTYSIYNT